MATEAGGRGDGGRGYEEGRGPGRACGPQTPKDGNWLCPALRCRFSNFGWRSTCKICGTTKGGEDQDLVQPGTAYDRLINILVSFGGSSSRSRRRKQKK